METVKTPLYTVSVNPHITNGLTSRRIMWTVSASLVPATGAGLWFFGTQALSVILLCTGSAVLFEYCYQRMLKQTVTVGDGSAVLTGLLLALNLPPAAPFYIPILGSCVAILLTKQLFGGIGFNIFNPALMGRAFLLISFPKIMTTWHAPGWGFTGTDALASATPLALFKMEGMEAVAASFSGKAQLYWSLFIGNRSGCIGETCTVALIAGAGLLIYKGYLRWHTSLSFLCTTALLAWLFGGDGRLFPGDPLFHLMSGGMILGACFMATDYVTSPATKIGQIIFGIGCGAVAMLIRLKGGYPEGVMFSILIMNCFAPLIDRRVRTTVFGTLKRKKQ